jgi:LPXTG-motif cell wall-anchored protein
MTITTSKRATVTRPVLAGLTLAVAVILILNNDASQAQAAAGDAGFLGAADSYAVLADSTVTNSGGLTLIDGDLGVSPGTAVTGFGPTQVTGNTDVGPTSNASLIGGSSPVPGVYSNAMQLTGTVTLDGNSTDVWVFKSPSTLTTATGSRVVLAGNANPCNVYWQVGSSATLDTTTNFVGTVLAQASISLNPGAAVEGRLLALTGAVTLLDNHVFVPECTVPADDTPPADDEVVVPPPTVDLTPPADASADGAAPVVETTATGSDATLPETGSDATPFLVSGVLLLVLGTVVLIATRRRTTTGV